MSERILFVLPLEERYVCPVHFGLLREPVVGPSGQNVCKACLKAGYPGAPADPEVNQSLQDEIDSLLCYCKYGVMVNTHGVLTADPNGCDHIIRYGNRSQHECGCEFRDADFVMIDTSKDSKEEQVVVPSKESKDAALIPCTNKDDGCFFLAAGQDELQSHLNECSYERLRKLLRESESRVKLLEQEIKLRDNEITELRKSLEEEKSKSAGELAKRALGNGREMFDEFVRVLEEELPQGVTTIKAQLLQSPAFMKSATALSSFNLIRSNVVRKTEKVRQDLSELHPLETLAALHPIDKLSELRPIERISEKLADVRPNLNNSLEVISEMHPLDKLIAILATLKSDIMTYAAEYNTDINGIPILTPSATNVATTTTTSSDDTAASDEIKLSPKVPLSASQDFTDDEDMNKQIAASIASFEEEKRQRLEMETREAAAVATAAIRSLQKE